MHLARWVKYFNRRHIEIFFFFFSSENRFDVWGKLSSMDGDNMHEMSNPVYGKNKKKCYQFVVCWICQESSKV